MFPNELLLLAALIFGGICFELGKRFANKQPVIKMHQPDNAAHLFSPTDISVTITNKGKVIIDGQEVLDLIIPDTVTAINFRGPVLNIETDRDVHTAEVFGSVKAGGNVNCGDIGEGLYIESVSSVIECKTVYGEIIVHTGSITADDIRGTVKTENGDITCENVTGNVDATGEVVCSHIQGDVTSDLNITCGNVNGNVTARGNVKTKYVTGKVVAGKKPINVRNV